MLRTLLFLTALLLLGRPALSQDWLAGSSGNFVSEALDVVVDANGNSIVTGYFSGEIRFNDTITQATSGFSDIFVAKFNPTGGMLWLKRFGGNQADRGHKLAVDASGNIYLTGYFAGSMTMGATTLTSNGGSRDIFVAKLTPAGIPVWARRDGGPLRETPNGLALDAAGNVVITGQFEGTTNIGGVSFTSTTNPFTSTPSMDIFIAKFTNAGAPVWTKEGHSNLDDMGIAVTCDNSNNIFVTGQYPADLTFIGQNYPNVINNAGYVAKLTPAGDVTWFRRLGAAQTFANDIELNSANEIYITGNHLGNMLIQDPATTTLSNPYIKKIFLVKFGTAGNLIWGKLQGSDSDVSARGITIDNAQNVYICGDFRCDFDEYQALSDDGLWSTVGFRDVFVSKFSPAGAMLWNKHSGGKKEDLCYALANGGNDKPIFAGSFENNFHIPTDVYNLTNISTSPNNIVTNGYPGATASFPFYTMAGDLSKNVFVGKVNDTSNPNYYYYEPANTPYDYIDPKLLPAQDTIEFCNAMYLHFVPGRDEEVGPEYDFHWSADNLDQNPYLYVAHAVEWVVVTYNSIDGCTTFSDSIYTIPHGSPTLPLMTDDHDFNTLVQPYSNIYLCEPDTAVVHFNDLCEDCTMEILYYNVPYHDDTTAFEVFTTGDYNVIVTNEFGCTSQGVFAVINDSIIPYDSIYPQIVMIDYEDFNDSLTVCEGEEVQFMVIDTITNPNATYTIYSMPFVSEQFNSQDADPNMNVGPHSCTIIPDTTGWYTLTYFADIGFINACGTDTIKYTVVDSFYIEVYPNPAANITLFSDSPLCPGDTGYVSVSQTITGATWSGSNILWQSADHDSIRVVDAGYYSYNGSTTNPDNGCVSNFNFGTFVFIKQPPLINMSPDDGLICPNGSVTLTVYQAGTYNWIGPDGSTIGTTQSIDVNSEGLYSCIFTDQQGCEFLLEQVQITEYITPFLAFSPLNVFCDQSPVELIPVYNGNADVHWLPPITTTGEIATVTVPGTYYCEITQCGTTTLDSVTVYQGSFTPVLTADDPNLCPGGSVTLTTNPDMLSYAWNDTLFAGNTITVTEPGVYTVTIISQLGCEKEATITIGTHPPSQVPNIQDVAFSCQGDDLVFTDNSGMPIAWYAHPTDVTPAATGSPLTIMNIPGDTVIYASYYQQPCPFVMDTITIAVTDTVVPPPVSGDQTLCEGQELLLSVPYDPTYTYNWTYNGVFLSDTTNTDVPDNVFTNGGTVQLTITNVCSSEAVNIPITIVPELQLQLNVTTLDACADEPVIIQAVPDFNGELFWENGGMTYSANPLTVTPANWLDSVFTVYGVDQNGCYTLPTWVNLNFFDCNPVAPNVLTVNGDGLNDYFIIPNSELMPGNYFVVMNRWGNTMYEADNYHNQFNGLDFTEGVYFYLFYRKGRNSDVPPIHGFFQLIRN